MSGREQQLIDMMFEIAMVSNHMKAMSNEKLAEWVRYQLKQCGFDTVPVGSSWGVLKNSVT